jgi:hypothetical protein
LSAQPELVSRFEFSADELSGDVEQNAKVFRRAVFPKRAGEQTIPPISWSYFDPTKEQYVTLTTSPITIVVDAPPEGAREFASTQGDTGLTPATGLSVLRGGVSPNYVDPAALLADQSFSIQRVPLIVTLGLPPVLWLTTAFLAHRRAKAAGDAGFIRRRRALRAGRQLVGRAVHQPTPAAQLQGLAAAMTTYLSHRFDLPPGTLTPADARELIGSRVQDAAMAREVAEFLAECDAVRYAPSMAHRMVPHEASTRVRRWMARIERNGS